jgi:hypothetical protein
VSNQREILYRAVPPTPRAKSLVVVGVLGALILLISVVAFERVLRSEPPSTGPQQTASVPVAAVHPVATAPARSVSTETLLLLLLGAGLFCAAAAVKVLARDLEPSAPIRAHAASDELEAGGVVRTARATGTTS